MWPATIRRRSGRRAGAFLLAFLAFLGDHDAGDGDDQQEQQHQHNGYDNYDDPDREGGFFLSFSLCLLAALNQPIDFGMLREESLYFFKLWNRRGVLLVPVINQPLTIEVVSRTQIVRRARALHVFHHGICRHDK